MSKRRTKRRAAKERTLTTCEAAAASRTHAELAAQTGHDERMRDFRAEKAARLRKLLPADATELFIMTPDHDMAYATAGLKMHDLVVAQTGKRKLATVTLSTDMLRLLTAERAHTGMSLSTAYLTLAHRAPHLFAPLQRCLIAGEPQAQVAAELGTSQPTVHRRVQRSLAALELLMQQALPPGWIEQIRGDVPEAS